MQLSKLSESSIKKALALAFACVLGCGLLAGCSSGDGGSSAASSAAEEETAASAAAETEEAVEEAVVEEEPMEEAVEEEAMEEEPMDETAAAEDGVSYVDVVITDDSCDVTPAEVGSGYVTFNVTNAGTQANEFEILANDRLQIISERENITPGQAAEVTVILEPGDYFSASKTNMVGALVDVRPFTVTDSGFVIEVSEDEQAMRDEAVTNYIAYIQDQAGQLLAETENFVEVYKSGDFEQARALYAPVRAHYERIEPTAEAFGDIDPALDYREADLNEGDTWTTLQDTENPWTGWHKIEKDLWKDSKDTWLEGNEDDEYDGLSDDERAATADQLLADTQTLYDMVSADDFTVGLDDVSNGAIDLLEEVATSKISGEEEAFSRTDLWDFQANVEGAQVAYGNVKKLCVAKNPDLADEIDAQLETMHSLLAQYGSIEDGYRYYNELSDEEVRELSDQVNALRNPLAQLTSNVLGIAPSEDEEEE